MQEGPQNSTTEPETIAWQNLVGIAGEINHVQQMCRYLRVLLDEGTAKLEAILKIIAGLKNQEQNILMVGEKPGALAQINEAQIDDLLEMLKTPAFQKLARQLLLRWINPEGKTP